MHNLQQFDFVWLNITGKKRTEKFNTHKNLFNVFKESGHISFGGKNDNLLRTLTNDFYYLCL